MSLETRPDQTLLTPAIQGTSHLVEAVKTHPISCIVIEGMLLIGVYLFISRGYGSETTETTYPDGRITKTRRFGPQNTMNSQQRQGGDQND